MPFVWADLLHNLRTGPRMAHSVLTEVSTRAESTMYLLYNVALWLAAPLLLAWATWRAHRGRLPGLRRERLGRLEWQGFSGDAPTVWVHAVSLGEVKAAAALIEQLHNELANLSVVVTSSTRTGWEAARQILPPNTPVLFPPWDFAFVCRRFLGLIRPDVVVILETELWPNLFRECKRAGAALVLANGRISDRTFPRYRATRAFWRRVFAWPDVIFVQSSGQAERFRQIGAPPAKVREAGNLKYSIRHTPSPLIEALRQRLSGPLIVAGSTMPGEEQYLIAAYQQLATEIPMLSLVLAPRHPERVPEVVAQLEQNRLPFWLRSRCTSNEFLISPGILVLDTIGELGAIYEVATVAFVGGTLVPTGGHNILEPASFARPIVIGPSMTNFQEIAREFLRDCAASDIPGTIAEVGAIVQIPDSAALVPALRFLLHDSKMREHLGQAAHQRYVRNAGGASLIAGEVAKLIQRRRESLYRATAVSETQAVVAGKTD
ncbi:MAG: 3-deoxy-D-manno-octulosonic acid transferase [Acidobacteria bacterium]|nr:3-deoxy-D-manno-octulosonic acid transferase [Acidobacteriota bacterium]